MARFTVTLWLFALFTALVSANSGIFDDQGNVLTPPDNDGADRQETNAERLRRGLSVMAPRIRGREAQNAKRSAVPKSKRSAAAKAKRSAAAKPKRSAVAKPKRSAAAKPKRSAAAKPKRSATPKPKRSATPKPKRSATPKPKRSATSNPKRSALACAAFSSNRGTIGVYNVATGENLGYVSQNYNQENSYTYNGNISLALTVSLPSASPSSSAVEVTALNGADSTYSLVGFVGGSGGYYLSAASSGYTYMSGTGHSDLGSPTSSSAGNSLESLGYVAPSESTVWRVACDGQLTADWVNTDGTDVAPATLFYDEDADGLGSTGSLDAYNDAQNSLSNGAYEVEFVFEADP